MPATQAQLRFWSLDQLNPGNPALNMPLMWQCSGDLDRDALHEAFRRCVARHESLRTTFALMQGQLCQIIKPELAIEIPLVDLTGLAGEAQRLEQDRLTREHAAFRFDLRKGPLLELKLLKLSQRHHLLLVSMHHIICDGISNGVLMRDMLVFYEAIVADKRPELPELPIQFADYAVWHEDWRTSPERETSLAYWRQTLGQDFSLIRLPQDPKAAEALPPHRKDSTGEIETLLIPPDLTARAHAFCKREDVTLNVLLFSVFVALLSRLTEQKDLTIGSPCANRTEDTENLIGLFMNIQVLRVRLEDRSSFRDLLSQVSRWSVAAAENSALPFEDLVHDSFFADSGNALAVPIFFLYQKSFMLKTRVQGPHGTLEVTPLRSESPGAIFEIMCAIVDREEEGPRLQMEYNPQFFTAATMQRYMRLFINLLDAALQDPTTAIDDLNTLSAADAEKMLVQWNRTQVDYRAPGAPFTSVVDAFLDRVAAEPDRIAVVTASEKLTYAELERRVRLLAARLVRKGLKPGEPVAICSGRTAEMLIAVLAVLMAGGAYVPLDPRHPKDRTEKILRGSGAAFVLGDRVLDLSSEARLLQIGYPGGPIAEDPLILASLPIRATAESLAYVIFTSGSTGDPKGVAIEHGSLMNLLQSMAREPGLDRDDVLVAITTLSFDIATLELLLPLLTGARLVIATEDQAHTPTLLLELLEASKATVLQATPGAWRALIEEGWGAGAKAFPLKVLCGGDSMSRNLADQLLERSQQVWNMYGPTETTIWSSATRVTPGSEPPAIGPPIANTQFYILDHRRQPVAIGIIGTLYIGGAGVARGYWNNQARTSAKFLDNPFAPGRLYETGDLARWNADGSIQLLGRADFQVKVRGYRIELGEIEAVLLRHPQVREAVVVQQTVPDQQLSAGVARMVAYVDVGSNAEDATAPALIEELELHLSRSLPDYMLPNAVVALDALPRNTNGKIDRKALPDVFVRAGNSGIRTNHAEPLEFLGPRDNIERQLSEIWQTALRIDRISVRASFFSLGVGSLAALRLITKMNRIYGMDLGLATLLSASSIESIAELIRNRYSANMDSTLVPIKPDGTRTPLFIVHGVGGNVVNFHGLSMRMAQDQPVYGVQAQTLLPGERPLLRLEDMARRYLREIRTKQPQGPYKLLGYSFGGFLVLEMAHQLRAAGEEVSLLGMLDSRSKRYEEGRARELSVQDKIERRVAQVRGNTNELDRESLLVYLKERIQSRLVRVASVTAGLLGIRTLPKFINDAHDVNFVALKRYTPRPFDGRMTLFRASEQDFDHSPEDLGWSDMFTGGVEVHEVAGDHERIFLEPSIDVLAEDIRMALERAEHADPQLGATLEVQAV